MPPVCDIAKRLPRLAERKQHASAYPLGTGKGTGLLSVLCQSAHRGQRALPNARSASELLVFSTPDIHPQEAQVIAIVDC